MVIITGDVANRGSAEDYILARQWIETDLLPALPRQFKRDHLFVISGNHDVDRHRISDGALQLQKVLLGNPYSENSISKILSNSEHSAVLLDRHKPFVEFQRQLRGGKTNNGLPWWSATVTLKDNRIFIAGACSSWMCTGDDKGKLLISRYQMWDLLPYGVPSDTGFSLFLLHHPLSYLADFDFQALKPRIEKFDILLRGHLHAEDAVVQENPEGRFVELAAGAAYGGEDHPNCYQLVEVFNREKVLRVHYRLWQYGQWVPFAHVFENAPYGIVLLPFGHPHPRKPANIEPCLSLSFRKVVFKNTISRKNALLEILAGESITERHVMVTAGSPLVHQVQWELTRDHLAVLAGEHGSGKSAVAFTVARHGAESSRTRRQTYAYLSQQPMTALNLRALKQHIRKQREKILLIFDDFHIYGSQAMLDSLREMANNKCKILVVLSIDRWQSGNLHCPTGAIIVEQSAFRQSLRKWTEANASLIGEIVGETKSSILESAAISEMSDTTAYGFVLSLSGRGLDTPQVSRLGQAYWEGWRVLLVICLYAAFVEERGISWNELADLTRLETRRLRSIIRDLSQYDRTSKRFVILGYDRRVRTPHVGLAGSILRSMGSDVVVEEGGNLQRFLGFVLEASVQRLGAPDRAVQRLVSRMFTYGVLWLAQPLLQWVESWPHGTPDFVKQMGFAFHLLGARGAAREAFERAQESFHGENNVDQSLRCAYWSAFIRYHEGQSLEALKAYESLIREARARKGLRDLIPKIHRDRAQIFAIFTQPTNLSRAEAEAEAAICADRKLGLHPGWSHCWLAQVYLRQQRYQRALKELNHARTAFASLPDQSLQWEFLEIAWTGEPDQNLVRQKRDGLFWSYYLTGLVYQNQNQSIKALYWYQRRCLPETRLLANAFGAALCYAQIAGIWHQRRDDTRAYRFFSRAQRLFESCGATDEAFGPVRSRPEFKGTAQWLRHLSSTTQPERRSQF